MLDYKDPQPPQQDKRWKMVQAEMRRHGYASHSLIQVLHAVQSTFGYLDKDSLRYVAEALRVPLSRVYGVATFYHYFSLKPLGEHVCVVCTGTACYIKGVPQLLEALNDEYGIGLEETTPDRKLSVTSARCVGACGLAPVVVTDNETHGRLTPEMFVQRLREVIAK
ncbi:NAD(P)H-dependent oxidoreductase subunit E [candidate division GN15 bacterium]|jgi:bidirectional [NiFe] hydrogenase diaphorase subunit|nr:NAD(P)H-dependent oxidoreductase subunit E [candidate division GN15 bacterium]